MSNLRIIGDVHGKTDEYLEILRDANEKNIHTLQLGDLGFFDTYAELLLNPYFKNHISMNRFFGGNHDDYSFLKNGYKQFAQFDFNDFCLGDYGNVVINDISLFFVRGAFSIDAGERTEDLDWWPDEEIDIDQHQKILDAYSASKPNLVVTHECPHSIGHDGVLKRPSVLRYFGYNPEEFETRTSLLLDKMLDIHMPNLWVFGHYHQNWERTIGNTIFCCLDELSFLDI